MFDPTGLSRVELEHVLARSLEMGLDDDADAIVTELAGRTWQNHNPYAEWPDPDPVTARHSLSGPLSRPLGGSVDPTTGGNV